MLERDNTYYASGYPAAGYRKQTSAPIAYHAASERGNRSLSRPYEAFAGSSVPPHGLSGLDSLEEMLHVSSERHRQGHRASPHRAAATASMYHDPSHGFEPHVMRMPSPVALGAAEHSGYPQWSRTVSPAPPPAQTSLATDLYVMQLEQEVEALTLDCDRMSQLLCRLSTTHEQRGVQYDEVVARRGLEQAERESSLVLWSMFHGTLSVHRNAHWIEQVRTAHWKQTVAEEKATALAASKVSLERHIERLEQQIASANASVTLTSSVEALLKMENEKLASLLEQVPSRVCTEMSAAATPSRLSTEPKSPLSSPRAAATGVDPQLRELIESIAEQLRARSVPPDATPTQPSVAAAASSPPLEASGTAPAATTTAASLSWRHLDQLATRTVHTIETISEAFLRASDEKLQFVEYEMKVALLVHNKHASITWATRNEDLQTEKRRLEEMVHSLRTQLKLALSRDVTPSASLVFNQYGGSGEKRARLYAHYASPYIPPNLEITAAPTKRSADDLRREALRLGARPADVSSPTPSKQASPDKKSHADRDSAETEPWRFTTNTGGARGESTTGSPRPSVTFAGVPNTTLSGTFSLPSHPTDSGVFAPEHSDNSNSTPRPHVGLPAVAVSSRVEAHAAADTAHDDASSTLVTARTGSLSGVPQVKRFNLKKPVHSRHSSDSGASTSSSSSDTTTSDAEKPPGKRVMKAPVAEPSPASDTEPEDTNKKNSTVKVAVAKATNQSANSQLHAVAAKRKNSFNGSTSSDDSTDLTDSTQERETLPRRATSTTAAKAAPATNAAVKRIERKLSSSSSGSSSGSSLGVKPKATAAVKTGSAASPTAAKEAPKSAPKAAPKSVALKRTNSFDDDSSDGEDERAGGQGSYTYSYSASVSAASTPLAAASNAKPAPKARRSSFDDEEEAKPAKAPAKAPSKTNPTHKVVAKAASAVAQKAPAQKPVVAGPSTSTTPAAAAAAAKAGGLKLPSW